jgi:hypothetical protein
MLLLFLPPYSVRTVHTCGDAGSKRRQRGVEGSDVDDMSVDRRHVGALALNITPDETGRRAHAR